MVSFKSLFLLATTALVSVSAKPLQVRSFDADLMLLDLKVLDDSVKGLSAAISTYPGGIAQATPILVAFSGIHTANRKTFGTCSTIKNLTASDSYTILNYYTATLGVDIPAAIKELEGKKALVEESGLKESMVSSLDLMKYDHESLSQVMAKKESQEQDVQLKTYVVVKEIDDAIIGGIAAFS